LNQRLGDQRIVIFGAGTAGCGIAEGLLRLLEAEGLSRAQALQRIWAIDRQGLLLQGMPGLKGIPAQLARNPAETSGWARNADGVIQLDQVVAEVQPTVLIGTSTVAGAFHEELVRNMVRGCPRPVILPLSNPTALAEASPADLLRWSDGRALVATGSPFPPVEGRVIGQCNNCFLFPGLGFAAVAVGLTAITDSMIDAGLQALAERIPASRDPRASLMPALEDAPAVAQAVGEAVARQGVREGRAHRANDEETAIRLLRHARWRPDYTSLQV